MKSHPFHRVQVCSRTIYPSTHSKWLYTFRLIPIILAWTGRPDFLFPLRSSLSSLDAKKSPDCFFHSSIHYYFACLAKMLACLARAWCTQNGSKLVSWMQGWTKAGLSGQCHNHRPSPDSLSTQALLILPARSPLLGGAHVRNSHVVSSARVYA